MSIVLSIVSSNSLTAGLTGLHCKKLVAGNSISDGKCGVSKNQMVFRPVWMIETPVLSVEPPFEEFRSILVTANTSFADSGG